jgi:adenylyltransferase/sulfurtransferase
MTTTDGKFFRVVESPPQRCDLTAAVVEDRLPAFDGGPLDAPAKLAAAVVSIVGLGSIGRPMAEHLARVGVGTLRLIDRGVLKPQSVLTHAATTPRDIGQPKASNAGRLCKTIRSAMNVHVFDAAIETLPPAALLDSDLVLLASDNLAAEVCVGQLCASLSIPLAQLSVHGETLIAQMRTLANNGGECACLRCGFGEVEETHLRAGQHFSCDGGAAPATRPTMSISALCGLAAATGATAAVRHILGLGEPLRDEIHEWCGFTNETWRGPLRRRGDCPTDHRAWKVVRTNKPLADHALRDIVGGCGLPWSTALILEVDAFVLADPKAGGLSLDDGTTPRVFARRRVPAAMLEHHADPPLATITPAPPRWVKVECDPGTCLVVEARSR